MKQHPVPIPSREFASPSSSLLFHSLSLFLFIARSFSFIRSLNAANKNNTADTRGGRGLRRIIKITVPTDRTIAGSLARTVDVADARFVESREKFESTSLLFSFPRTFLLSLRPFIQESPLLAVKCKRQRATRTLNWRPYFSSNCTTRPCFSFASTHLYKSRARWLVSDNFRLSLSRRCIEKETLSSLVRKNSINLPIFCSLYKLISRSERECAQQMLEKISLTPRFFLQNHAT